MAKRDTSRTFRHSFAAQLLAERFDILTVHELLGHTGVRATLIYTHALNRGGRGVGSPADGRTTRPAEGSAEAVYHPEIQMTGKKTVSYTSTYETKCLAV